MLHDTSDARCELEDSEPQGHVHGEFRRLGGCIETPDVGTRLDAYLGKVFKFLSRAAWQERIDDGNVRVNGTRRAVAYKLRFGDQLSMYFPAAAEPEVDDRLEVLYEEAGVMAIYKPGQLPMHENGAYRTKTFAHTLTRMFGAEWSAVHRLDRETSGIVLCAAEGRLRNALSAALRDKKMGKEYVAFARGRAQESMWDVNLAIGDAVSSQIRIKKWVVDDPEKGLSASTRFEVERHASDEHGPIVQLRALPRTGRTNQIRIHSAASGLPIVGDKLYHPDEAVFLRYFAEGNSDEVQKMAGFPRHCLHAAALVFIHPVTRREVRVDCPIPSDMSLFWGKLAPCPA